MENITEIYVHKTVGQLLMFFLFFNGCRNGENEKHLESRQVFSRELKVEEKRVEKEYITEKRCEGIFEGTRKPGLNSTIMETIHALKLESLVPQCNNSSEVDEIYRYIFYNDFVDSYLAIVLYKKKNSYYLEKRWNEKNIRPEIKILNQEISRTKWNETLSVLYKNNFWKSDAVVAGRELASSVHYSICFVESQKNGRYHFIERLDYGKEDSTDQLSNLCSHFYKMGYFPEGKQGGPLVPPEK